MVHTFEIGVRVQITYTQYIAGMLRTALVWVLPRDTKIDLRLSLHKKHARIVRPFFVFLLLANNYLLSVTQGQQYTHTFEK